MNAWFFPLSKRDDAERLVSGIASSDTVDSEGEVVTLAALQDALPDYLLWGNIREMHQPSAVGVALRAEVTKTCLELTAKIIDDAAWQKVVAGVYKGFSIGGRVKQAAMIKQADGTSRREITALQLMEISLVDRPANPDAKITMWKRETTGMEKMLDPRKAMQALQGLRNQAEIDGDAHAASLLTDAIRLVIEAGGTMAEPLTDADLMGWSPDMMGRMFKAGRVLSADNVEAIRSVMLSLIRLLSAAGDEQAQKLEAALASKLLLPGGDALIADTVQAVQTLLKQPIADMRLMATRIDTIEQRRDMMDAMPAPGGPVTRDMGADLKKPSTADLAHLRRRAATEPDLRLRAGYQQQLINAQATTENGD